MGPIDRFIKAFCDRYFVPLLGGLGVPLPAGVPVDVESLQTDVVEAPPGAQVGDRLYRIRYADGGRVVVLFEPTTYTGPDDDERMRSYLLDALRLGERSLIAIALHLTPESVRAGRPADEVVTWETEPMTESGATAAHLSWRRIALPAVLARGAGEAGPGDWARRAQRLPAQLLPLLPMLLPAGGDEPAVAEIVESVVVPKLLEIPDAAEQSVVRMFTIWAFAARNPRNPRIGELVMGKINELIRQMPIDEIPIYGEMRRQILAKGREEGREEGARAMLERVARDRFGEPTPAQLARLARMANGELQARADRLSTATDWEEFLAEPTADSD
jgi:hypothetical protein